MEVVLDLDPAGRYILVRVWRSPDAIRCLSRGWADGNSRLAKHLSPFPSGLRSVQPRVTLLPFSELQPRSAALRDPQARKEVERRLQDLARQGTFITEASRELDEILTMRGGVP